jgi:hypothetical protein
MIRDDLPVLLGYENACLFIYNDDKKSLYSINLDEEGDRLAKENGPPGFERDFVVESGQVVEFPVTMGLTSYS